jgi:hypothetical protein
LEDQDRLRRALARISAQVKNLNNVIDERYDLNHVRDFHEGLGHLSATGVDVSEWMIPLDAISHWDVERAFLLARMEGVLGYIELTAPEDGEPPTIGFTR